MGTRSGSIDPTIIPYLMKTEHMSAQDVEDLLNKRSGFLGVSGLSNDSRNICDAAAEGNPRAQLALNILYNEIKKYIGSYVAEMNGIDALVFTAGIGENQDVLRREVLEAFGYLGLKVAAERNAVHGREAEITTADSAVRAFVIPTNEELVIARDTRAIVDA